MADSSAVHQEVEENAVHQAVLDKMTSEREHALDRHADSKALGHTPEETALNHYQKNDLKYLFGETGFNPPVPPRNPILVTTHNPRFSAALWAINGEAYRRKGLVRDEENVFNNRVGTFIQFFRIYFQPERASAPDFLARVSKEGCIPVVFLCVSARACER